MTWKPPRCSRCKKTGHNKTSCRAKPRANPPPDDQWVEMNRIIDAHGRAIDAINATCNLLLSLVRERRYRSQAEVDAAYFPNATPRQGVEQTKGPSK